MDNAITIYDKAFNANEWFVLVMIIFGGILLWVLPKRFTLAQSLFNVLFGIFLALMFDHTIAVEPFDLYDIGDESQYQLYDLFSYCMYAPFGYLYIYGYEYFRIRHLGTVLYILLWTTLGIAIEMIGVWVGVFHYKNGYHIGYSIPIYLFVQSLHLHLYYRLFPKASGKAK
jgi:hypothetical protein